MNRSFLLLKRSGRSRAPGGSVQEASLPLSVPTPTRKPESHRLKRAAPSGGERPLVVSTWSRLSPGNTIENQPPALLPGMGITANCLLHNYLPKMKALVILVSDSPNVRRPITASARLAGVPAKAVSGSYSERSRLSWVGRGRLPEARGVQPVPCTHPVVCQSWEGLEATQVGNEARPQSDLSPQFAS